MNIFPVARNVPIAVPTLSRLQEVMDDLTQQVLDAHDPESAVNDNPDQFIDYFTGETGADLACEAFVEERSAMQASLYIREEWIVALEAQVEQANAVLRHIGDYANQLQAALNRLGIEHGANPETGEPVILIDKDLFLRVAAQLG